MTVVPHRDALVDALVRSAYTTTAVLSRVAAAEDLSLTQLRMLAMLRGRTLRMSRIAERLGLERSTLSGLIDRAERRGLVRRAPSADDRRVIAVELTDAGVAYADRIGQQISTALAPLIDALDADDARGLRALLEKMLRAADGES